MHLRGRGEKVKHSNSVGYCIIGLFNIFGGFQIELYVDILKCFGSKSFGATFSNTLGNFVFIVSGHTAAEIKVQTHL